MHQEAVQGAPGGSKAKGEPGPAHSASQTAARDPGFPDLGSLAAEPGLEDVGAQDWAKQAWQGPLVFPEAQLEPDPSPGNKEDQASRKAKGHGSKRPRSSSGSRGQAVQGSGPARQPGSSAGPAGHISPAGGSEHRSGHRSEHRSAKVRQPAGVAHSSRSPVRRHPAAGAAEAPSALTPQLQQPLSPMGPSQAMHSPKAAAQPEQQRSPKAAQQRPRSPQREAGKQPQAAPGAQQVSGMDAASTDAGPKPLLDEPQPAGPLSDLKLADKVPRKRSRSPGHEGKHKRCACM